MASVMGSRSVEHRCQLGLLVLVASYSKSRPFHREDRPPDSAVGVLYPEIPGGVPSSLLPPNRGFSLSVLKECSDQRIFQSAGKGRRGVQLDGRLAYNLPIAWHAI